MHHAAVRPEISGAVAAYIPCKEYSGELAGRDAYPWISLGILKEDIVLRLVLLDEIVLQKQGVGFRVHYGVLGIGNLRHQKSGLGIQPFGRDKVLGHPFVQILGLAHIDNFPLGVIVTIDTGGMREK